MPTKFDMVGSTASFLYLVIFNSHFLQDWVTSRRVIKTLLEKIMEKQPRSSFDCYRKLPTQVSNYGEVDWARQKRAENASISAATKWFCGAIYYIWRFSAQSALVRCQIVDWNDAFDVWSKKSSYKTLQFLVKIRPSSKELSGLWRGGTVYIPCAAGSNINYVWVTRSTEDYGASRTVMSTIKDVLPAIMYVMLRIWCPWEIPFPL